jgi:hypothetical protein
VTRRPHIQDLAVDLGSATSTADALAQAAHLQGLMFAATLLETGPVTVGTGWLDRAQAYVILADPIEGKVYGDGARFYAKLRTEAGMPPWTPLEERV